ncbi:MAG: response regulator [Crocinitomicaceae bacterium]|nr:response regulator [Crocinitomicaceae bacterium]
MILLLIMSALLIIQTQRVSSVSQSRISLSVRQKALIDDIGKTLLLMQVTSGKEAEFENYLGRVKLNAGKWENAQKALMNGSDVYGTNGTNSDDVQRLLHGVTPSFVEIRDMLQPLVNSSKPLSGEEVGKLIARSEEYVSRMADLTGQFTIEAEENFNLLKIAGAGLALLAFALCIILYSFLLKPSFNKIQVVEKMLESVDAELDEAKQAKTNFLANMSHEIRTPLNGVIGMTELMAKTKLDEEQRGFVRNIHSSALNLLDLVNDILDFAQMQSGKLELFKNRFVMSDCIDQVIDLMKPLANAKKLELMSDIDPKIPAELLQDERRLRQVLLNLVNNAIKFTENGEILIKAELVNRESDFVQVKFSVADTGIGIEADKLGKLFEAFSQTDNAINKKYGGSGLGLSISKNLVAEMGGRIWVESTPMKGATFSFTIVAETSGESQLAKISALNGLKALVIDDNKTNLKILVKQLSAWGVQATPFNSPDLVNEIVSNLHKFDFCLMDMQMPEMDGRVLTEKIREKFDSNQLPIIVLSSIGQHLVDLKGNLYNAYLTKPVRQAKLLDTIIDVLHLNPDANARNLVSFGKQEVNLPQNRLKVLIAHDNELTRAVTAKTLQLLGHKYEAVNNGQQVLDYTQRESYDLIIMDVNTPELNGVDTVKKMKKNSGRNDLPVIIGLTENEDRDKKVCLQAGMDDLIPKPMNPEMLTSKIHYWFEEE